MCPNKLVHRHYEIKIPSKLTDSAADGTNPSGLQEHDCWRAEDCYEIKHCYQCIFSENNLADYNRWVDAVAREAANEL